MYHSFLVACYIISVILICAKVVCDVRVKKGNKKNGEKLNMKMEGNYVKPKFKPLTKEQINDIHARGKITPKEKVKEWEGLDLCAPGDAIGSASWRCHKFDHNCHDCLVDYANEHDEYISIKDIMKLCDKGLE